MYAQTRYSPREDEIVRDMAARGSPASACARYLKRTRNSVIGRSHRLGVNFHACTRGGGKRVAGRAVSLSFAQPSMPFLAWLR